MPRAAPWRCAMMVRQRGHAGTRFIVMLVIAGLVALGVYVGHDFWRFSTSPLQVSGKQATVDIERGSSFRDIVALLEQQNLTAAPVIYWQALARGMRVTTSLKAGQYAIKPDTTPIQLLRDMADGDVIHYQVTLVDGWTFKQLRAALDKADHLKHEITGMSDAQIMRKLGSSHASPEGLFLPETYFYVAGDSDMDVLERAYKAMQKTLAKAWAGRDKHLPFKNRYQALTLASIVEKETGNGAERSRIAGVFVRRLKKHMMLQSDPTVIYGMGDAYHGNITRADLHADTPWNTYVYTGLPPTPIAMPGKAAIDAVMHPATGKALYFVARGDGSGRHVFSDTLAQHDQAVACYQLKRCK